MFVAGMRVAVLNRSYSGTPIFEGWAYITKVMDSAADGRVARVKCKFFNKVGRLERETVECTVHKDWQADPEAFVAEQRKIEGREAEEAA